MHVNFYKKPQIKTHNTPLKVEKSVLFLDYLDILFPILPQKEFKDMERWVWHIIPFGLINLCFEL